LCEVDRLSGAFGLAGLIDQTLSNGHYFFSGDRNVDATLIGSKWVVADLTFSFPTEGSVYGPDYGDGEAVGLTPLNPAQQSAVRYALGLVSEYTGLTFTEVAETADSHAILRFGQTDAVDVTTAYGNFPDQTGIAGDVWFGETGEPYYTTPDLGNWGMTTIMHEIGHALGLKHGHEDLTAVDLQAVIDADGSGPRYGSQDAAD